MTQKLPTEWAPCPELDGIEIKLDSGTLMFRLALVDPEAPSHLVGWWVRPASAGRASTAVLAFNPRGGTDRLGSARHFPDARKLIAKRLGRPVGQGSARHTDPGAVAGGIGPDVVVAADVDGEASVVPVEGLGAVVGTGVPGAAVEAVEGLVAGASVPAVVELPWLVVELLEDGGGTIVVSGS